MATKHHNTVPISPLAATLLAFATTALAFLIGALPVAALIAFGPHMEALK